MTYRPLRFFSLMGSIPFTLGVLLCIRWLILFDPNRARTPSLILAAIFILIGFQLWMFGLVADVMSANRKILEDVQLRLRRAAYKNSERQRLKREKESVANNVVDV